MSYGNRSVERFSSFKHILETELLTVLTADVNSLRTRTSDLLATCDTVIIIIIITIFITPKAAHIYTKLK